jgi:hypothetical protein
MRVKKQYCSGHRLFRTVLLMSVLLLTGIVRSEGVSAYDVKAGFLFNFSKFIHWSEDDSSAENAPFVIGIYGENPFGESIFLLEKQRVQGRPVDVRIISEGTRSCSGYQMIFIPDSQRDEAAALIDALQKKPVVLIGESPDFARSGGMINFYLDKNRIAFQINLKAFHERKLDVSSRLLRLAQVVEGDTR